MILLLTIDFEQQAAGAAVAAVGTDTAADAAGAFDTVAVAAAVSAVGTAADTNQHNPR